MSAVEKIEERNPLENLDQDLAVHIYRHSARIFEQYNQLGNHLSQMSQVKPRDVTIQYRHLFAAGRLQTEYLYDMAAVSYLVRHFNGANCLQNEQELRKIAQIAAGEALNQINEPVLPTSKNPANSNTPTEKSEESTGPGIVKARAQTTKQRTTQPEQDQQTPEELSGWLADSIDTWGKQNDK